MIFKRAAIKESYVTGHWKVIPFVTYRKPPFRINSGFEHSKVLGDKAVLQKVLLEIQMREFNKSTRAQGPPVQLQLNFRTVIQRLKQEEWQWKDTNVDRKWLFGFCSIPRKQQANVGNRLKLIA